MHLRIMLESSTLKMSLWPCVFVDFDCVIFVSHDGAFVLEVAATLEEPYYLFSQFDLFIGMILKISLPASTIKTLLSPNFN